MNLLSFDTSTEFLSVAVQRGDESWAMVEEGATKASSWLIPAVMRLLEGAHLTLGELDCIVFGRGPGSFSGLRTACAVAQGLAYPAHVPVLPVDTLLALAEAARQKQQINQQAPLSPYSPPSHVLAVLDARMREVYSGAYIFDSTGRARRAGSLRVCAPQDLTAPAEAGPWILAGNILGHPVDYTATLDVRLQALERIEVMPTAQALITLAPALLESGQAVGAEQALPLYIRDKVALTTQERLAAQAGRP